MQLSDWRRSAPYRRSLILENRHQNCHNQQNASKVPNPGRAPACFWKWLSSWLQRAPMFQCRQELPSATQSSSQSCTLFASKNATWASIDWTSVSIEEARIMDHMFVRVDVFIIQLRKNDGGQPRLSKLHHDILQGWNCHNFRCWWLLQRRVYCRLSTNIPTIELENEDSTKWSED